MIRIYRTPEDEFIVGKLIYLGYRLNFYQDIYRVYNRDDIVLIELQNGEIKS